MIVTSIGMKTTTKKKKKMIETTNVNETIGRNTSDAKNSNGNSTGSTIAFVAGAAGRCA